MFRTIGTARASRVTFFARKVVVQQKQGLSNPSSSSEATSAAQQSRLLFSSKASQKCAQRRVNALHQRQFTAKNSHAKISSQKGKKTNIFILLLYLELQCLPRDFTQKRVEDNLSVLSGIEKDGSWKTWKRGSEKEPLQFELWEKSQGQLFFSF